MPRRCCYRDNDGDGNCDIHESPGKLRPHIRARLLSIEPLRPEDLKDQPLNDQIFAICEKVNEIIEELVSQKERSLS